MSLPSYLFQSINIERKKGKIEWRKEEELVMVKSCLKENVNLVSTEWSKISVVNQGIPHTNPDFLDRHADMKAEAETGTGQRRCSGWYFVSLRKSGL